MDSPPGRPPYEAYAFLVGSFSAGLFGVAAVAKRREQKLESLGPMDFTLLALATFKASRTIARDKVTSFIRDPFVEGEAYEGGEEPVHDDPLRQAIGELVTCTRCTGTWVGAALASLSILAPRTGRLLTTVLAAGAANDFLQTTFTALAHKSDELRERV